MNLSPGFSAGSVAISKKLELRAEQVKYRIAITMNSFSITLVNSCSITLEESQYIIANTEQIHMSDT
jgi:hypothetical protein